jgi:hypothetical protein
MTTPHDTPFTFVSKPGAGQPAWHGPSPNAWNPSDSPDEPYQDIDDQIEPVEGVTPANIVVTPGPFTEAAHKAELTRPDGDKARHIHP